jgi:hypothetical protein
MARLYSAEWVGSMLTTALRSPVKFLRREKSNEKYFSKKQAWSSFKALRKSQIVGFSLDIADPSSSLSTKTIQPDIGQ